MEAATNDRKLYASLNNAARSNSVIIISSFFFFSILQFLLFEVVGDVTVVAVYSFGFAFFSSSSNFYADQFRCVVISNVNFFILDSRILQVRIIEINSLSNNRELDVK